MTILLYLLVPAAYIAAAALEWRQLAPRVGAAHAPGRTIASVLAAGALLGHATLLVGAVYTRDGLDVSLANALSAVAGLTALIAWLGNLGGALPGVAIVALPVAALSAPLPALFPNPHRFSLVDEPWSAVHIGVALTAYALFIVAALQALLLMGFERRLHRAQPDRVAEGLPPLLTLERFLFRLVDVGFGLLTLTLLSGALFSEQLFGKPFQFRHKEVFTILSWFVFAALLYGRHRYGWRGRSALKWIVAGTILLFLAYAGSKFVLEVILGR